mgnify:CR=1 FL=1
MALFSYGLDFMQHLLEALQAFCQSNRLTVNVDKTKMMVVRTIQPIRYPTLAYKGEHVQFVKSFNYLGIDVPPTNKWICALSLGFKTIPLNTCNEIEKIQKMFLWRQLGIKSATFD